MANSGKDINFGADLLPTENGVYDLGSENNKWNAIYGTQVDATSLVHYNDGASHFKLWADTDNGTGYAKLIFTDYESEFEETMVSIDNHGEHLIFYGKAEGLNMSAGSSTRPVYIDGAGIPTACSFTLNASVPSGAKFTDTTYTLPAATSSTLGGVKVGDNLSISSGVLSANVVGTTLYSSTSGTQSTVTLSTYASSYSYLDIYYTPGSGNSATSPERSTRVICPTNTTTNKYVVLNVGFTASSQYIQWKHETVRIYDKYIYRVDAGYVNADKNANLVSCGSGGGNAYITRVVGIK